MTALLIAEHDNVTLKSATAQALTAALRMTDVVDVLVAGSNGQSVAEQAAKLSGVRTVYYADHPQLAQESPEVLARLVLDEAEGYSHVLFVASAVGKSAMPRVAAKLDVSPVSDVLDVKGPKTFVRGIYAGSLLATVEVTDPVVVATIRTTAFKAARRGRRPAACGGLAQDACCKLCSLGGRGKASALRRRGGGHALACLSRSA